MKRVFLIVLDSFGIGAAPDAAKFGDEGANTLKSCADTGLLRIPNLIKAGLGNIRGVDCLPKVETPASNYGRLAPKSAGKDTTLGHWELAGVVCEKPLPTYPKGFPNNIIAPFTALTGRGVLANAPYSGTEVIEKYGAEHMKTGDLIVYTSADSVFQIAAHEKVVPPVTLYEYCRIARNILSGDHGVGRVIARPFVGKPGSFKRTANRHDFSLAPPAPTVLDKMKDRGFDVIGVGKIRDIFAGQGLTEHTFTVSNQDGMEQISRYAKQDFHGLLVANLVDFDMLYGHRRDPEGYALALNEFDAWLGDFLPTLDRGDAVIVTADHGCDPAFTATTDHTREYVPFLAMGKIMGSKNIGSWDSFNYVACSLAALLR